MWTEQNCFHLPEGPQVEREHEDNGKDDGCCFFHVWWSTRLLQLFVLCKTEYYEMYICQFDYVLDKIHRQDISYPAEKE